MPIDLVTTWVNTLEKQSLGFILDDDISVPDAVRRIGAGKKDKAKRAVSPTPLIPAELTAAKNFLDRITITGFRNHPEQKDHSLGRVNLIVGSNGVGKTSLLEAIEFGYCGRNRRSSPVLSQTSVMLELANTTEKLLSTTDAARLRARHSHWYAKTELKKVSIQDSFGKFNFLDTDAAVNLSVSASTDQIGADVMRLVLGASAENLADRVRRVLEQLQSELNKVRNSKSTDMQLKLAAEARIASLTNTPETSDSLFSEMLTALRSLKWLKIPEKKNEIAYLRDDLQNANTCIKLIRELVIDVFGNNLESTSKRLEELKLDKEKVIDLRRFIKKYKQDESKAKREIDINTARISAIQSLILYAQSDFKNLCEDARKKQININDLSKSIASVQESSLETLTNDLRSKSLEAALLTLRSKIEELRSRLLVAKTSLELLERTKTNLTNLHQRLLSTAHDILQRSHNPDHCPLCHSEFEEGQLITRIMSGSATAFSSESDSLLREISVTNETIEKLKGTQSVLDALSFFSEDDDNRTTVNDLISYFLQDKTRLEEEKSHLQTLTLQIDQLKSNGLSIEDLAEKLATAGIEKLPSYDELESSEKAYKESLSLLSNALKVTQDNLNHAHLQSELIASKLSLAPSVSTDVLEDRINTEIVNLESAMDARRAVSSLLSIDNIKVEETAVKISAAHDLFVTLSTANAQESANDINLHNELKTVSKLSSSINSYKDTIKNYEGAGKILKNLSEHSSGEELSKKILADNAEEISHIFSSIHMPNEFDLKVENGMLSIIRRQSGNKVDLDQMSTGQRVAFALSLFLTMNQRLHSGPPILLFDDPVAHIDDIKVLSFLDHLRQIAIAGSRQIFFATADTKLAGLFRHKFRFLGNEFKEISLLREIK